MITQPGSSPWRSLKPKLSDLYTPLNLMTLSRLLLILPLLHFLSRRSPSSTCFAVGVMALWAFNDWLDGYLARGWSMGNAVGIVLDPLVDRLSTAGALVGLVIYRDFPIWAGAVIVGKELAVVLAGLVLAFASHQGRPSNVLGKANQCVLGACMVAFVLRSSLGAVLLWVALAMTFATTLSYALSLRKL